MSTLKTQIEIPLSVPVTVAAADGKEAERSKLVMRRPKVRHTKWLAALIGKDLVNILAGDGFRRCGELVDQAYEQRYVHHSVLGGMRRAKWENRMMASIQSRPSIRLGS